MAKCEHSDTLVSNAADPVPPASSITHGSQPSPGPQGDYGRSRAVIFSKMKAGGSREFEDAEVREYEKYLDLYGFIVMSEDNENLQKIGESLAEVARESDQLVALIVRDCVREADLDYLVKCLGDANESAQKLLIYCRIVRQDDGKEEADCLKLMGPIECQKNLRNTILFSVAVESRKLAGKFLNSLMKKKKKDWETNGIGFIRQYEIEPKEYEMYRLRTNNGLSAEFKLPPPQPKLLKDVVEFRKMIGDGSQLKQLDSGATEYLRKSFSTPGDVGEEVYKNCGPRKALIIHNVAFDSLSGRPESHVDYSNLRHILTLLQYQVVERLNLTAAEIEDAVKAFANDSSHGDSSVLAVMSHGRLGVICGTDFSLKVTGNATVETGVVKEADLLRYMRNGTGVKGKPRLIVFQACRDQYNSDIEKACGPHETAKLIGSHYYGEPVQDVEPSPDQCGMIVGHSTSPGEAAVRRTHGSRFVLALCATLYEYAHREDVVAMVTRVNYIMTHGFKQPYFDGMTHPQQLPWWSVQTDKKFFLTDTSPLFARREVQAKADVVDPPPTRQVTDELAALGV